MQYKPENAESKQNFSVFFSVSFVATTVLGELNFNSGCNQNVTRKDLKAEL